MTTKAERDKEADVEENQESRPIAEDARQRGQHGRARYTEAELAEMWDQGEPVPIPKDHPPGAPLPWECRKPVGMFRLIVGMHNEGGITFNQGDEFVSRSNLNTMNAPGCVKFEQIGELDMDAVKYNQRGGKVLPTYKPENPNTLSPEQLKTYRATGMVPVQTGQGKPENLGAGKGGYPKPGSADDTGASSHSDEELNAMTIPDLKEMAEEEEIDISGATRKDEIIAAIQRGKKAE